MRVAMKPICLLLLALSTASCSVFMGQPQHAPLCYQALSSQKLCFATERELSEDVARRQRLAVERAAEERAKQLALAIVAERDAKEAAERARSTVERADRIQDDAFEILVEIHEDAVSRASAAESSSSPESVPAPR
jgi:hypothetical protein